MAATVITVFTTAAMVGVMLTLAISSNDMADVQRFDTEARYLAEGALEITRKEIQTDLANWGTPDSTYTVDVSGRMVDVQVSPNGFLKAEADPSGINTWHVGYIMTATAGSGDSFETVRELITAEATPIFQFAVFYTTDLEMYPGPDMDLRGRVHSNQDMFLTTKSSTVTMDTNYVRAVGDINRHSKYDVYNSAGQVDIRKWVADPFTEPNPEFVAMPSMIEMYNNGVSAPGGYGSNYEGYDGNGDGDYDDLGEYLPWVYGALEYWKQPDGYTGGSGTTVLTGDHGIGESVTPQIEAIGKYAEFAGGGYIYDDTTETYINVGLGFGTYSKGFFHQEAAITIMVMEDGTYEAYDNVGTDISAEIGTAVNVVEIYDARQGGDVTVAELDLEVLAALNKWPANKLIYACSEKVGEGTDCGGVIVKNGKDLPTGLSVVSEGALYVQGDFNTDGKQGASVMADAVSLLSNAWDGSKDSDTGLTIADQTTFNVAIVTGNTDSLNTSYNGGLENLPRFHEKWSGVDCNITGSFVNTWRNEYCTGNWKYGSDNYTAPKRIWTYDTDFNDLSKLPPYTPLAVSAATVVRW